MAMLTPDFLANIPIFRNTSEAERNQLLQTMVRERFAAQQDVVRSGETGRGLHVIVDGSAVVILDVYGFDNPLVAGETAHVVDHARLARLEIGSVFGEVSFFHGGAHSATVRAATDLELLTLRVDDYHELLRHQNLAAYKIAVNAAGILADRLRAADVLISDLVLAQSDSLARTRWFDDHMEVTAGVPSAQ